MGVGVADTVVTVEVDVSGTPYGEPPTWTDVTERVLTKDFGDPIDITWGRQDWASDIAAGSCSFTLDNRDGAFTPAYAGSPYYPNVKRRARCRVWCTVEVGGDLTFTDEGDYYTVSGPGISEPPDETVTFAFGTFIDAGGYYDYTGDLSPVTVYLFDGLIDSWNAARTSDGMFGTTNVSATDMLGRYSADELRNLLYEEILHDVNTTGGLFYPLNDQGPTLGDYTGTYPTLAVTLGAGAPDVAYQNVTGCADSDIVGVGLGGFFSLIEGVEFSISSGGAASLFFATSFTGVGCDLIVNDGGTAAIGITPAGIINDGVSAGPNVADGLPHHLVVINGDGWYLDGVKYGTVSIDEVANLGFNFVGTIWAFAVFFSPPSMTRFAQHRVAALTGFAGETTDEHIARLLSYRPNFGSSLNSGLGTVGVHPTDGIDLQQALYDTADAEGGGLFADGQGRIVFLNRGWLFSPAVTLSLDDTIVQPTTVFRDDIQDVVNDVTVTTPAGATQRYIDAASVAADGSLAQSYNLIVGSDAAALAAAKWRVQVGVQDRTSTPQLDIDLFTVEDPAVVAAVLQLQPLNVVAVTSLPVGAAPTVDQFMVQGGQIVIAADQFDVTLATTAVPAGDPY